LVGVDYRPLQLAPRCRTTTCRLAARRRAVRRWRSRVQGRLLGAFADRLGEIRPLATRAEISLERVARGPITSSAQLNGELGELQAKLLADGLVWMTIDVTLTDADDRPWCA
jgi:hypothetical protein